VQTVNNKRAKNALNDIVWNVTVDAFF